MQPTLRVRALTRRFPAPGFAGLRGERRGGICALDLDVEAGACVALLGANGSGKTTALRCMAGLDRAQAGEIRLLGSLPTDPSARRQIGYVPEVSPLPPHRSGRAFLEELGHLAGMTRVERRRTSAELLERFEMSAHADRPARSYSKGMLRRIVIAQAFLLPRALYLFDEPTSGLDALGMLVWQELISRERSRGAAIVMSSHWSAEALEVCDRAVVLEDGVVRREAAIHELFVDPEKIELVIRGLDDAALDAVCAQIEAHGGQVLQRGSRRRELRDVLREIVQR